MDVIFVCCVAHTMRMLKIKTCLYAYSMQMAVSLYLKWLAITQF